MRIDARSLLEINTRVHLRRISQSATLDNIPDSELDSWQAAGFDWIWLLGVWQTGPAGKRVALAIPALLDEYASALPDYQEADVCGSCFSVQEYRVHSMLGGDEALTRLRARLRQRGMRLMLDFVPNHTALDHPWATEHPDLYVQGTTADLTAHPENFVPMETSVGPRILAHGRDPNFPGWSDTLQVDYSNPASQAAMLDQLRRVASLCDGVRCDMAMLLLPEVFERTWGRRPPPFWPAAIQAVRAEHPNFVFMAEVYWDLEWVLQQQGFDFTYDKKLYDRLRAGDAAPVRDHLRAEPSFQSHSVRFLENHDEPRAAAVFSPEMHRAAAVISYLVPGLRFFHEGQQEGFRIRVPVQVCRGPNEATNSDLANFYAALMSVARERCRSGDWQLLDANRAWDDNWTSDSFICSLVQADDGSITVIVVNDSDHQSQSYVPLPLASIAGRSVRLEDQLSPAVYDRSGDDLATRGLYLDLPPWGHHAFALHLL